MFLHLIYSLSFQDKWNGYSNFWVNQNDDMYTHRLQIQRGFHLLFTQLFNEHVQLKFWFLKPGIYFKASYDTLKYNLLLWFFCYFLTFQRIQNIKISIHIPFFLKENHNINHHGKFASSLSDPSDQNKKCFSYFLVARILTIHWKESESFHYIGVGFFSIHNEMK